MTLRYVFSVVAAFVIASGAIAVEPAYPQQRDGGLLPPQESGLVTVVGCLLRGNQISGGDSDKYVLANPRKGPVDSAPGQTCTAERDANAVQLDNPNRGRINDSMLGRWVEISGRLERETSSQTDILRELDVEYARLLPVAAPQATAER